MRSNDAFRDRTMEPGALLMVVLRSERSHEHEGLIIEEILAIKRESR